MQELKLQAEGRNQELVLQYLRENASEPLAEKINAGKKTMSGAWRYITSEAQKQARNQVACIEDATVYGWAVHYFEESLEDLNFEPGSQTNKAARQAAAVEKKPEAPKQAAPAEKKKPEPKPERKTDPPRKGAEGQLDLFSILTEV